MKKYAIIFALAGLFGCAKSSSSEKTASESTVSESVETQISVINNATSDINTGNSTAISSLSPAEHDALRGGFFDRAGEFAARFFDTSLGALSFSCSSGSVSDTGQQFSTSAAFTVTRQWNSCVGDGGVFRRNGTVYLGWSEYDLALCANRLRHDHETGNERAHHDACRYW